MCGIFGYIGKNQEKITNLLINGLRKLEYRGYDSAGIAFITNKKTNLYKKAGRIDALEKYIYEELGEEKIKSNIGISHTRWATHGEPDNTNAHPHSSQDKKISIVHNGIIENYRELKASLAKEGYKFASGTDTEVLVHLIHKFKHQKNNLTNAVTQALGSVSGTYGILVIDFDEPDKIIVARKGSPIVLGIGNNEYFVASDYTSILEYTKSVVFLDEHNLAILTKDGFDLQSIKTGKNIQPTVEKIDLDATSIDMGGYDHFMQKEIYEQQASIYECIRGRVRSEEIKLGGVIDHLDRIETAEKITIVASGTSWHAGLVGEFLLQDLAGIPTKTEYASEYKYKKPLITSNDVLVAVSQSGETADTLGALEVANNKKALTLGICNVVGSSIARETKAGIYTHAGPEISVASTKAFTAQVTVFLMLSLLLARRKKMVTRKSFKEYINQLLNLQDLVKETLEVDNKVQHIAKEIKNVNNMLYFGRGINFPVAIEGALKLKEISYIHAEGYPTGEMKHGPIALVDENMPVVFIATSGRTYDKTISNIEEIRARKGKIIAIINKGDDQVKNLADYYIEVPEVSENISPLINTIPLQLLAYHLAILNNCDVDKPRNLAKSVTVE